MQTLDGRTLVGEVQLTNDLLLVASSSESNRAEVSLTNLLKADFTASSGSSLGGSGRGMGLLGFYFNGTNFEGSPFIRVDESIDFDWSIGSPAPGLSIDYFSVQWHADLQVPVTGEYRFWLEADDHAVLSLEQGAVLDTHQRVPNPRDPSNPIGLEAGKRYPLKLTYYDLTGSAKVRLWWSGPSIERSILPREWLHPSSAFSNHVAQVTTNQGLLGTYYGNTDFAGQSFSRVDPQVDFHWATTNPVPGVSRTNFSVRWTGQVFAEYAEEYTFYVATDERVRMFVDNKRLIDRPDQSWLQESKESIALLPGERYDILLETQSRSGDAVAKLMWSSGSIAKTNVPSSHLFPSRPSGKSAGEDQGGRLPPGVLLRNGSFLAGPVDRATGSSIRLTGRMRNSPISTVNAAQIICQPMSSAMQARTSAGRPGVLLSKGDFVDGEFRGFEGGQIRMSSVLFGLRTYATAEVLAIVLREFTPGSGRFEVRLRDQTRLYLDALRLENNGVSLVDALVGRQRFPVEDIASIQRN